MRSRERRTCWGEGRPAVPKGGREPTRPSGSSCLGSLPVTRSRVTSLRGDPEDGLSQPLSDTPPPRCAAVASLPLAGTSALFPLAQRPPAECAARGAQIGGLPSSPKIIALRGSLTTSGDLRVLWRCSVVAFVSSFFFCRTIYARPLPPVDAS